MVPKKFLLFSSSVRPWSNSGAFERAWSSIRENLAMTSPYVCTDAPGRGKEKQISPLSPQEFCPLLFQKALEMICKSESVN